MNHFSRQARLAAAILSLVLLMGISCAHRDTHTNAIEAQRKLVLNRAYDWIVDHPANFEDGGFLEMGEEINLHYIRYSKAGSEEEKKTYRQQMVRIIENLRAQKNFEIQFAGEITAYLVITKTAVRLGMEANDFHSFIKEKILYNPMTYPPNITYTILNVSLLQDLGYDPKIRLDSAMEQGVIAMMTKDSQLIPIDKGYAADQDVMNYFYDLTHEIFGISSFCEKNPEQMLMSKEIEFIREMLVKGVSLYLPKKQLDILGELVICAKLLNYTDFPGYQDTLSFILSSQEEDGSFGVIPRMKDLGRGNLHRHGVLVAAWALAL